MGRAKHCGGGCHEAQYLIVGCNGSPISHRHAQSGFYWQVGHCLSVVVLVGRSDGCSEAGGQWDTTLLFRGGDAGLSSAARAAPHLGLNGAGKGVLFGAPANVSQVLAQDHTEKSSGLLEGPGYQKKGPPSGCFALHLAGGFQPESSSWSGNSSRIRRTTNCSSSGASRRRTMSRRTASRSASQSSNGGFFIGCQRSNLAVRQ